MTTTGSSPRLLNQNDQTLARLVDEFSKKLERGEPVDLQQYAAQYPDHAEPLRRLLPAIQSLADLGCSIADSTPSSIARTDEQRLTAGVLGDFRIIREIGRGGMGVVYEAEQITMQRRVALKVLPFAAVMDDKQIRRFKNEALAAGQLQHTNIVPVYSVGCERGVHFYVMQFIDGQTLAEVIRELRSANLGPHSESVGNALRGVPHGVDLDSDASSNTSPWNATEGVPYRSTASTAPFAALSTNHSTNPKEYFRSVARLGVQAAEALEHAHESGVIHRDIKPSNLLLDKKGNLWITDFGLAHFQTDTNLTMTGDLIGTLRYMSPEQALAKRVIVDHRTDIYSLGVTLYELLTLQPAFGGEDRQELLRQIAFDEPRPLRRINDRIPPELETIVLKATAKNPTERYATAQEFASDVENFLAHKPISARRPSSISTVIKFARRHRAVFTTFAVTGFASLLLTTAIVVGRQLEVVRQRNAAVRNSETAELERQRAEASFRTALDAVERMLGRVAEDRLVRVPQMEQVRKGLLEDAVELFRTLLDEKASDPALRLGAGRTWLELGRIYTMLGDPRAQRAFESAVALLEDVPADHLTDPNWLLPLTDAHHDLAYFLLSFSEASPPESSAREAIRLAWQVARLVPDESVNRLKVARCWNLLGLLLQDGDFEASRKAHQAALTITEQLVAEFPEDTRYRGELSQACLGLGVRLCVMGREKEGEHLLRRGIALFDRPSHSEFSFESLDPALAAQVDAHRWLGDLARDAGRREEAEQLYDRALQLLQQLAESAPTSRHVSRINICYDHLTDLLVQEGESQQAQEVCRQTLQFWEDLLQSFPDLTHIQNGLAWFLVTCPEPTFHDAARAVELMQKAVQDRPDMWEYWNTLGAAHYRAGDWVASCEALKHAIRISSGGNGFDWFFLAMAEWKLGHHDEARRWYQRAVEWTRDLRPREEDLKRFRDEASELLGIEESCAHETTRGFDNL